jgi:hypothetical protein
VQITRTTPLRRMILHLLHIFLTDALTFMAASPCSITARVGLVVPVHTMPTAAQPYYNLYSGII